MATATLAEAELRKPVVGEASRLVDGKLEVPDHPIVPYIEGDGIGPEIWRATRRVLDAAVERAYGGERGIVWREVYAGEKARQLTGELLPAETIEVIEAHLVAIKGPLTTPIGSGFRSLNVTLRQKLNLYACIRPVKYMPGVPSPLKSAERVDLVIFRENTEDVYAGIEWPSRSPEAQKLIHYLKRNLKVSLDEQSGIGMKPMSPTASRRLIRKAIDYAQRHGRKKITLVHKGNIMKYTEGAFMQWGYELAREQFSDVVAESDLQEEHRGRLPPHKILLTDIIADIALAQLFLRPWEYDVIAAPNLNGDYMSEAAAALVGGVGLAPGANVGDHVALFEAIHGSAPKHAGKDTANPTGLLLSGVLMLEHMAWTEAARLVRAAVERSIGNKLVTYDLARQMEGATQLSTSQYAQEIISHL